MFEVYYNPPVNPAKESALTNRVVSMGGKLDYREDATEHTGVCLTFEFDDHEKAARAAETLRQLGEGMDYAAYRMRTIAND